MRSANFYKFRSFMPMFLDGIVVKGHFTPVRDLNFAITWLWRYEKGAKPK